MLVSKNIFIAYSLPTADNILKVIVDDSFSVVII